MCYLKAACEWISKSSRNCLRVLFETEVPSPPRMSDTSGVYRSEHGGHLARMSRGNAVVRTGLDVARTTIPAASRCGAHGAPAPRRGTARSRSEILSDLFVQAKPNQSSAVVLIPGAGIFRARRHRRSLVATREGKRASCLDCSIHGLV